MFQRWFDMHSTENFRICDNMRSTDIFTIWYVLNTRHLLQSLFSYFKLMYIILLFGVLNYIMSIRRGEKKVRTFITVNSSTSSDRDGTANDQEQPFSIFSFIWFSRPTMARPWRHFHRFTGILVHSQNTVTAIKISNSN